MCDIYPGLVIMVRTINTACRFVTLWHSYCKYCGDVFAMAFYKCAQINHKLVRPDMCGQLEEFKQITSRLTTQEIGRKVYTGKHMLIISIRRNSRYIIKFSSQVASSGSMYDLYECILHGAPVSPTGLLMTCGLPEIRNCSHNIPWTKQMQSKTCFPLWK